MYRIYGGSVLRFTAILPEDVPVALALRDATMLGKTAQSFMGRCRSKNVRRVRDRMLIINEAVSKDL